MRYVYIDGYNVINSWPQLRKLKEHNFNAARHELIDMMKEYAAYNEYKIYIVFDAHMVSGSIEKIEKNANVMVVFTKEGETADSFIERSVNNIGRKKDVLVVTSDLLEQQLAFQRGAIRMSSLEFKCEVFNVKNKIRNKTKQVSQTKKSVLQDIIDKDVLEKLEKIRRNN